MRALVGFCLLVTVQSAFAVSPAPSQVKHLENLVKRCEDGSGQDCFDYANLALKWKHLDRHQAAYYFRRACTLAYQPACNRPSVPQKAKRKLKRS